jgi:peptidoglycan/xylan/chitin deacetylase (PgdA/CDA1 family)
VSFKQARRLTCSIALVSSPHGANCDIWVRLGISEKAERIAVLTTMKALAKKAVLGSGLLRLAARLQGRGAAILMYHSVLEDPSQQADSLGGIMHARPVFRQQMELLAREFHPLSMDELAILLRGEEKIPERCVVVTFDDGYRDNFENAMPILDQFGIRAAFYVTVDSIEKGQLPWPSRVRFALRTTRRGTWTDPAGARWSLETKAGRDRAFAKASEHCCRLAGAAQERLVAGIEVELATRIPPDSERLMMNWDELQKLSEGGHVVGSHTLSHPNVAQIPFADVRVELEQSRSCLEKQLNHPVVHFSYPCPALSPHWNEQTVEECRRAGYETAVVADSGLARKHDSPLCLRRVPPSKTVEGLRWNLECAFAGRAM